MSDKNTSTLQSYVDSATSAVQSAIGAVTGNPADKVCFALLMPRLPFSTSSFY